MRCEITQGKVGRAMKEMIWVEGGVHPKVSYPLPPHPIPVK